MFHDFYSGVEETSKSKIAISTVLCLVSWLLSVFQFHVLAVSIGIQLPLTAFFAIYPVTTLLDVLPISFSGIGTRDAALIFFFSLFSIQPEISVSLSLLFFVVSYMLAAVPGLLLWMRNPVKIRE